MSCRLPGGIDSLDSLWSALMADRDLISQPPPERFDADRFLDPDPQRPGKTYTLAGGYLTDIAGFDADYFGISPREARLMDPQHRLLLEMASEAFDDAGIAAPRTAGSDTGVFVGMSDMSYGGLQQSIPRQISAHCMSGGALSIAANRLSYVFDLRGPSMTVDTACSSALVAMHQACENLRTGRIGLAVVGGVNLLLNPYNFVGFSKASMLSRKGRCATFSAEADGYARAEGGGVLLVKRLSDALSDGDRVLATILGSGTNADGAASGVLVPAAETQTALLRDVYSGLDAAADDLVYFEAHGTGTPIGDPVECEAVGRALGTRRDQALPLGSIKTNLGHLEPASGIAGVLKGILVLRHGVIPASLHADPLDPAIAFDELGLDVVRSARTVPVTGRSMVGVNSFGFGGANAHVVLGTTSIVDAPSPEPTGVGTLPVVVSARTAEALADAVRRTAECMESTLSQDFYDACYTAARRRQIHPYRTVVFADTPAEAAERLSTLAADVATEGRAGPGGRVAFAFAGNGTQWAGMGARLLREEPAFAKTIGEVDAVLTPMLGWSVAELLSTATEPSTMAATEIAQPALFALQVGLVRLLGEYGVRPAAVVGYSVGEVGAAYVAGALDLETAARIIVQRSRVLGRTAGQGRMAAVGLSAEQAERWLASYAGRLEVAGINTARHVTVSGDEKCLRDLAARLTGHDVFVRELDLDYAFHSHVMDQTENAQREALADVTASEVRIPMVSTVTGALVQGPELTADYWWRNTRQTVRFADGIKFLVEQGIDTVVEIGPDSALKPYLRRANTRAVSTVTRASAGTDAVRTAVATVVNTGAEIEWSRFFRHPGRVVDLPAYPWQREHYWHGDPTFWAKSVGDGRSIHPLLGDRVPVSEPTWHNDIEPARLRWLADHAIDGAVIFPAAGYIEMALAAGWHKFNDPAELDTLDIPSLCVLSWDSDMDIRLQTSLSDEDGLFRVSSQDGSHGDWRLHARGRVRRRIGHAPASIDPAVLRDSATTRLGHEEFYGRLDSTPLTYGPEFRLLRELWISDREVLARYEHDLSDTDFLAHPSVLDAALQAGAPLLPDMNRRPGAGDPTAYLPMSIGRARVWAQPTAAGFVHVRLRSRIPREVCWDITITDEFGAATVEMRECRMRRVDIGGADDLNELVTVPLAKPRQDQTYESSPLPKASEVCARAEPAIADIRSREGATVLEMSGLIRRHLACNAVSTFRALLDGRWEFTVDDLLEAGVLAKYAKLIALLANAAQAEGMLNEIERGKWRLGTAPEPSSVYTELRRQPRDVVAGLIYGRFGLRLGDVLRGRIDPLDLLFRDSGSEPVEWFYENCTHTAVHNRAAGELVRVITRMHRADQPLRILEVGGGTGGMTAAILPLLPADRTSYVFTDVSPAFFPGAGERFAEYQFVRYQQLDLDKDLGEQGFGAGQFDLILASNALHTATDLRAALRRLAHLLSDGGQLLSYELHDPSLLALVFGPLDGFWAFTDTDLRSTSPLVPADRWPSLLHECGFTEVIRTGLAEEPAPEAASLFLASRRLTAAPAPALPEGDGVTRWLIASASQSTAELATALDYELTAAGCASTQRAAMSTDADEWARLIPDGEAPADVVLLFGPTETEQALVVHRAAVIRAIADASRRVDADVTCWLVLPSAEVEAGSGIAEPTSAAVWGLARSMSNELPWMEINRISLERGDNTDADTRRLAVELIDPDDEDEIMLTPRGRFVPRMRERPATTLPPGTPHKLALRNQGLSYQLRWVECPPASVGPDEVRIEVRAASLNYRDMMIAVGLLPPVAEADGQVPSEGLLGLECAGVVAEIGSEVTGLGVGDRVFGPALASLASHAVTKAKSLATIPEGMSFAAAATMPVAYLTVHYGLGYLAHLAPGETVLVHGAAGGVGQAAIQFAELCGARVIATAGSPAKRDLLRLQGVHHVLDSRSMNFADEVLEITAGRGVDVVLNSLGGDGIARGLDVLAPNGRFVELGKRDLYGNSRMLMGQLTNNTSFLAVDIAQLALASPEFAAAQFADVARRIHSGDYQPLAYLPFSAAAIPEAFRLMQHSRHIGKIVISFDESVPVERNATTAALSPEATYLVTGGLSGFGAATARRLVERGARHVALVGRRGETTPGAQELVAELTELGARVSVHAADVADRAAMRAVFDSFEFPLRGVVHAAMLLDDDLLTNLGDDRFQAVLTPKMGGALVLDELTRGFGLEFFVVFSSAATVAGNVKQSAYVAGNAAAEALVRARHRRGEPGLAVQWGAIKDVGYSARTGILDALGRLGIRAMTSAEALDIFDQLLSGQQPVVMVGRLDWGRASEVLPGLKAPRTADLLPPEIEGTGYRADQLVERLREVPPAERPVLVEDALAQMIAVVMQTTPERLDHTRPLDKLGLDSLMAMELVLKARKQFQVDIPPMSLVSSSGTITAVSAIILDHLGLNGSSGPVRPEVAEPNGAAAAALSKFDRHQLADAAKDTP
jgi:acyl transferase domain-containing protein/NADPH:quinone reductase-like Zn-dependent oxidoreductase/acyl carrier protein